MTRYTKRQAASRGALMGDVKHPWSIKHAPASSDAEVERAAALQRVRNEPLSVDEPSKVRLAPCKFLELPDVK